MSNASFVPASLVPALRTTLALGLVGLFAVPLGCEELMGKKAAAHPGCPGESSRSAKSANDCTCLNKQVLKAGAMECDSCDPTSSAGAYCDCGNNSVFSFDGRLDQQLGLISPQVECVDRAHCGESALGGAGGEPPMEDPACACGPYECGPGCGSCPVGGTCISGICVLAGACRVKASTRYDYQKDNLGRVVLDAYGLPIALRNELNSCERNAGSIFWFDYVSPTNFIGLDCSFAEEDPDGSGACDYQAEFEALSR